MSVLTDSPFPFHNPKGYQLWRVIAGFFPVPLDATSFVEQFGVDPLELPVNLSPRQLWHLILEKTAIKGTTGALVKEVLHENPRSPHAAFLTALLNDAPVAVSPEPVAGFDPAVTQPEALLFTDDLTMPTGRVSALIATLQRLQTLAPAVCLLRVQNPFGDYYGTGFRIGTDLVLTNEHVLFPEKQKATSVQADFGFDVDSSGTSLPVTSLTADVATIQGDRNDDWAVVKIAGMGADIPIIALAGAPVPKEGDRAFIVQHPGQQQKRLGYVRNTVSSVTNDRVQYLTDTQPGSSGAPVFNAAGNLIALHHRGGTPTQFTGKPPLTKNQGVRIDHVYAGLKNLGLVN